MVNNKKCAGHGACVQACPYNAIRINPDTGKAIKCIQCGECVERCPVNAIWMTTDEELEVKDSTGELRAIYDVHEAELYDKEGLE
jgi:ferredoxin